MFGQTSWRAEAACAAVLVLYVVLVGTVAWHHEPWFDEAQAWLIARDSGLAEILWERARYEGTPPLWHVLLFPAAKMGLPYGTLTAVSVVLAAATVYLFLRYSPFPWYVKAAFPFGFFTVYQYAVVARSYTPMALVLMAIAAVFRKRYGHPVLFFTLLALLACANAHGFILAGFLAAYHLWHLWPKRTELPAKCVGRHVVGAVLLGLVAFAVVILVRTPEDLAFPVGTVKLHNVGVVFDALTPNRALSLGVLMLSGVWFARRKTLALWAAPACVLLWLFIFKWASPWHEGIIYYWWIFCVWVAWEEGADRTAEPGPTTSRQVFRYVRIALALVVAIHVYWGAACSYHDLLHPYSGSREAHAYLVEHDLDQRQIHAHGFSTVSVLPYFSQNIFDNYHAKQNPSYLLWARGNPLLKSRRTVCAEAPQYVLVGVKFEGDDGLHHPSYRLVRRFEGRMFWKDTVLERNSLYLYQLQPEQVAAN